MSRKVYTKIAPGKLTDLNSVKYNHPFDYKIGRTAVEVKTFSIETADLKIRMSKTSADRKVAWAKEHKLKPMMVMIVYDHKVKEAAIYKKPGVGHFRVGSMEHVTTVKVAHFGSKSYIIIKHSVYGSMAWFKGGAGSGNFGHAGRVGEVGGSASEGFSVPVSFQLPSQATHPDYNVAGKNAKNRIAMGVDHLRGKNALNRLSEVAAFLPDHHLLRSFGISKMGSIEFLSDNAFDRKYTSGDMAKKEPAVTGYYQPGWETGYLGRSDKGEKPYIYIRERASSLTAMHELSHHVDHSMQVRGKRLSELKDWTNVWRRERDGVSRYGMTNPTEGFAEAYTLYAVKPLQLKKSAPKTYSYMKALFANRKKKSLPLNLAWNKEAVAHAGL